MLEIKVTGDAIADLKSTIAYLREALSTSIVEGKPVNPSELLNSTMKVSLHYRCYDCFDRAEGGNSQDEKNSPPEHSLGSETYHVENPAEDLLAEVKDALEVNSLKSNTPEN
ncbi:hypothetical protein [Neptuniibacter sp. QD37_11]|uniref:hypothetical protein n=1 Tax=Neptuniibacter sp. QD37_11 TaxID=3398209 RepID=UPI0039F58C99